MTDQETLITTPRLHLSRLDPYNDSHVGYRVYLSNSPEVQAMGAKFNSTALPQTIEGARISLVAADQRLDRHATGRFLVSLRKPGIAFADEGEDREYIGIVTTFVKRFPDMPCPLIPDIGFVFHADHQGKGFAREACEALMAHFMEAGIHDRFAGFTHPDNMKSQKLFTRLGFQNKGVLDVAGVGGSAGAATSTSVWVKGVDPDTELSELGIGPGTGELSKVGRDGVLVSPPTVESR
jgi:RimJ/RimL family protein N-acetyltransferase